MWPQRRRWYLIVSSFSLKGNTLNFAPKCLLPFFKIFSPACSNEVWSGLSHLPCFFLATAAEHDFCVDPNLFFHAQSSQLERRKEGRNKHIHGFQVTQLYMHVHTQLTHHSNGERKQANTTYHIHPIQIIELLWVSVTPRLYPWKFNFFLQRAHFY